MTNFRQVVRELAHTGVAYRRLGDVAEVVGKNVQPARMTGDVVVVHSLPSFDNGRTPEFLSPSEVGSAKTALDRPVVLVAKLNPHIPRVWRIGEVLANSYCSPEFFPLSPIAGQVELGYLYYFLLTKMSGLAGAVTGGTNSHKRLQRHDFRDLRIPVPPLEVQREIVEILDHFTELEAGLGAELEARRLQYAAYRDRLLTEARSAGVVALGEIAEFKYGYTATAEASGDYRFLRITDITASGKLASEGARYVSGPLSESDYLVEPGDLLMARTGATFGKTLFITGTDPAVYASFLIRIRFTDRSVLPTYYWHFAQSTLYWSQAEALVTAGGQPQFNANVLRLLMVPVPSLDEQERIVKVLDSFDALVNDPLVGLPAEIRARREQYEYYRSKLLTFPEAAA